MLKEDTRPEVPEWISSPSPEDWVALHQLSAEHWARVDRISRLPVEDLYLEDGEMIVGAMEKRGRGEIADYFGARFTKEDKTERLSRHTVSGLRFVQLGPDLVAARCTVVVFAGHGDLPIPCTPPVTIGDFEDRCVRIAQGSWRYSSRRARILFVGDGSAHSSKKRL